MTTLGIIWLTCLLWMTVSLIFYRPRKMGGVFDQNLIKDRTKTNFNLIALYFNLRNGELIDKDFLTRFKPLTPLQKEIEEEERTIKQLEAQRADIQRLEDLKRKREALFEEVGDKHAERVEVKRNGVWSERDARVYPSSLEWIKHDGSFAAEIGYTDNTSQVFYSGVHDLLLVEHLFRERKPINEEEVRL